VSLSPLACSRLVLSEIHQDQDGEKTTLVFARPFDLAHCIPWNPGAEEECPRKGNLSQ